MLTVSLDELVRLQRARAGLRPLFRFLGVPVTKRTRRYFSNRMTTDQANKERWREGISAGRAERVDRLYREALERLDAAGARSAPLLSHSLQRSDDDLNPLVYVYDRGPIAMSETPAELVFVGGTGRSGTHILSYLLDRHSRFHGVPIECRFHCNPKGLASVVKGETDPEEFVRKLRGYWWHRVRIGDRAYVRAKWRALGRGSARGLYSIVPPERFEPAVVRFEREYAGRPRRRLAQPLLRPAAAARRRGRQAGARRDELLHHRRGRRAGADLPRGAVRALGPRRARLRVLEGLAAPEAAPSHRRRLRDRVLGRPAAPGRGGRARALGVRSRPAAGDQPRRARALRPRGRLRGAPGLPRGRRRARDARVLRRPR